jgi:hypothetical protein
VPHHNVIGEPLRGLLDVLGVPALEVPLERSDVGPLRDVLASAVRSARSAERPVAVLGVPESLRRGA